MRGQCNECIALELKSLVPIVFIGSNKDKANLNTVKTISNKGKAMNNKGKATSNKGKTTHDAVKG